MNDVFISRAGAPSPQIIELLQALDRDLTGPYAPEQHHALPLEKIFVPHIHFLVARRGDLALACGGIALFDGWAELKRMYARPEARGTGVMRDLLAELEAIARRNAIRIVRIETGDQQHAALRFYEREGYRRRPAFSPYAEMAPVAIATSIFLEKLL
jgi:putative acetyltransferase